MERCSRRSIGFYVECPRRKDLTAVLGANPVLGGTQLNGSYQSDAADDDHHPKISNAAEAVVRLIDDK